MSRVLVVGSLNADLVVRTPRFPGPGETVAGLLARRTGVAAAQAAMEAATGRLTAGEPGADDDYAEVATKVTGSLDRWGCWNAGWTVPTKVRRHAALCPAEAARSRSARSFATSGATCGIRAAGVPARGE